MTRKKTLRQMPKLTRQYAKLLNEQGALNRRFKNLLKKMWDMEHELESEESLRRAEGKRKAKYGVVDVDTGKPVGGGEGGLVNILVKKGNDKLFEGDGA